MTLIKKAPEEGPFTDLEQYKKWTNMIRWVWVAKRQRSKDDGIQVFLILLKRLPIFAKKRRRYILENQKEFLKKFSST